LKVVQRIWRGPKDVTSDDAFYLGQLLIRPMPIDAIETHIQSHKRKRAQRKSRPVKLLVYAASSLTPFKACFAASTVCSSGAKPLM
jgi:hypothetical protein